MTRDPSIEELERALAANFDDDGNDISLADDLASMPPDVRERSEQNLREWSAAARAAMVRAKG